MLASELKPAHVGKTIVIGQGTKRRRGTIQQVFCASTYTRVVYEGNGTRSAVFPLDAEVELEF